jgi:hypothetical protein
MKRRETALVVALATLLPLSSGCIVEERPRPAYARQETYYYYPDDEVYYYPSARRYYWLERGEWRYGAQPPPRFVLRERERVKLDLDYEPHTQHARIKSNYPPGQYRKLERQEEFRERKDEGRERKEDWREEKKGKSGY